ncbi:FAD binding domain-containing protein [Cryphonectria parasitica EP155]|uniref:FAD binding domain-containing protein n=1 Tax=Cryphonectria parasitica (strain ATCC 38755 / EP155) TaxID=660469 RepID=A0A9P4XUB5_CRYP1|nr:FAD binding domain-containing protein [Cryphonectria parasitica EP155]KAF3761056.1 FAD binding domain-containing protein [Cryphonectria parasitica EP155]
MISNRKTNSLLAALVLSGLSLSNAQGTASVAAACQTLYNAYPELTLFSNATEYTTLNEDYFSAVEWLGPACIFTPTSAELVSFGVKTLAASEVTYAIQGGGHMPIAGAANINSSGILLSTTGLDQLSISEDESVLYVGPGNHWVNVYDYLVPYEKLISGGRMGVVGVPGYLLGGGISFFSNEYGWASAMIVSFETVLADGTIVNATADNEYSDLFWALRGGGNNFGIVTSFGLKTIDLGTVTVGQVAYTGSDLRDQYLQTVYDFAYDGTLDQKAAVIPTVTWSPATGSNDLIYSAMVFYGANDTNPAALGNFTGGAATSLPVNSSTFSARTMSDWSAEVDTGTSVLKGWYFSFAVVPILADLDAMGIVFDTFFNKSQELLANVTYGSATTAVMPISKSSIVNNRGNASGDPFGIDESKAPFVWLEQTYIYYLESDTSYVNSAIQEINAAIDAALPEDKKADFMYINDAGGWQKPFDTYASDNLQRLQEIRAKYDPEGTFTYQVPGGFKLADASGGQ